MSKSKGMKERYYTRFTLSDRIEHILQLVSFTVLVVTGIPQKFVPAPWAETWIQILGGIEFIRIVHRISASVMILGAIYHVITVTYKIFIRRVELTMLPTFKDVIDFLDAVRYNLGLAKRQPRFGRYNFEEKLEYWALIWGTFVMIVTGFMLWNPILVTKILPGSWIPAAKAAHGGEALLAALSILVWHVYGVHIKTFNRSMFTGKLTRHQMEHEHAEELSRAEAGTLRPDPPREVLRKRQRVFLPIAAIFTISTVAAFLFFITYEETAIATIPMQAERPAAFVRATATPAPKSDPTAALNASAQPKAIPHAITGGRENCLACHGTGALEPFSAFHAELNLGNETCLSCHKLLAAEKLPTVPANLVPSFSNDILPLFRRKCVSCHNYEQPLSLTSYRRLILGGESGPAIIPGDAEGSRLFLVQNMPLAAHPTRLDEAELALIKVWVDAGAPNN